MWFVPRILPLRNNRVHTFQDIFFHSFFSFFSFPPETITHVRFSATLEVRIPTLPLLPRFLMMDVSFSLLLGSRALSVTSFLPSFLLVTFFPFRTLFFLCFLNSTVFLHFLCLFPIIFLQFHSFFSCLFLPFPLFSPSVPLFLPSLLFMFSLQFYCFFFLSQFLFFPVFKILFIFVSSFSIFLSFLLLKFHSHRVLSFLQFLFALPASPFPSFPMFSVVLFLISGIIARLTEMWIVETSVV